jgi:hypothetical protein
MPVNLLTLKFIPMRLVKGVHRIIVIKYTEGNITNTKIYTKIFKTAPSEGIALNFLRLIISILHKIFSAHC